MSNEITIRVEGIDKLTGLIKKLPDRVKKSKVNQLLGQAANPLLIMMRSLTPVSSGIKKNKSGSYKIKRRQVGKTIIASDYTPGYGKKTIAKAVLRKSKNPLIAVGPRSRKGKDGYYLRQWVIPGTKNFKGNEFVERAQKATEGVVSKNAVTKLEKYIQKQIDKF